MGLKYMKRSFLILAFLIVATVSWQMFQSQKNETGFAAFSLTQKKSSVLSCSDVRARIRDFTRMHYSTRSFTEEISKRTFQKYFQTLDPGKNFFLQEDIEQFKKYETTLPDVINNVDCRFITDVYAKFLKRVEESEKLVNTFLKSKLNFEKDETIEVDRKKINWAKDENELKERWRKQIKFWALSILETEPESKNYQSRLSKRFAMLKKSIEDKTPDEIDGMFLNAFALSLDPHSSYMLPEEQDEFHVQFSLQLVGIGATLTQVDGYTIIENVIPGGPAAKDGRLKKGDKIIGVDSGDGQGMVDVIDMELNKVVARIRGKKDTKVKLMILRKDETNEVKRINLQLTRDVVQLQDAEAKSDVLTIGGKKIGVINLPSFYIDYQGARSSEKDFRSSALDMEREVKRLVAKKVDGIVIDLRHNGGGDLGECVKLTSLFIDNGVVVQVADRDGETDSLDTTKMGTLFKGPLLVLTSKQSASASEIFAGAIQDYGRGLIVGNSRTYGKGTVQQVVDIPGTGGRESNGAMRVTTAKFYRPSGKSNQEKGVISDIQIPDILEILDIGEAENDYVLPYSTIRPSRDFEAIRNFTPYIDGLKKKSQARINSSKEFKDLEQKIAKAEKEKNDTKLPLKLKSKKEKKAEDDKKPDGDATAVIRKDDIQLKEAAHILVDSMAVIKTKDWAH